MLKIVTSFTFTRYTACNSCIETFTIFFYALTFFASARWHPIVLLSSFFYIIPKSAHALHIATIKASTVLATRSPLPKTFTVHLNTSDFLTTTSIFFIHFHHHMHQSIYTILSLYYCLLFLLGLGSICLLLSLLGLG